MPVCSMPPPNNNFKQALFTVLANVPPGAVISYGQLAKLAGFPGYARHVGYVLKTLPNNSQLPWHRVVNAKGRITFGVGSEAYHRQAARLAAEGISVAAGKLRPLNWYLQAAEPASLP